MSPESNTHHPNHFATVSQGRPRLGNYRNASHPDCPLTDQQQLFVGEYLIDLNGRQAAIRAGFSPDAAESISYKLLRKPNIRAEIERQYALIYESLNTKAIRVLTELGKIAYSDLSQCYGPDGSLLSPCDMPDSIRPVISGFDVKRTVIHRANDVTVEEYLTKVRFWSKTDALNLLGKHHGLLNNRVEITGKDGGPIEVSPTINIDALPLWLKQALIIASAIYASAGLDGSGSTDHESNLSLSSIISPDLERRLSEELNQRFIEVEFQTDNNTDNNGKSNKSANNIKSLPASSQPPVALPYKIYTAPVCGPFDPDDDYEDCSL